MGAFIGVDSRNCFLCTVLIFFQKNKKSIKWGNFRNYAFLKNGIQVCGLQNVYVFLQSHIWLTVWVTVKCFGTLLDLWIYLFAKKKKLAYCLSLLGIFDFRKACFYHGDYKTSMNKYCHNKWNINSFQSKLWLHNNRSLW